MLLVVYARAEHPQSRARDIIAMLILIVNITNFIQKQIFTTSHNELQTDIKQLIECSLK